MSEVNSIEGLSLSRTLREFASRPTRPEAESATAVLDDTVEISELAGLLSRLSDLPEHRARRIVEVRSAVAEGTYITPEKLNVATDRLLEELSEL